jgi:hypothetical protein
MQKPYIYKAGIPLANFLARSDLFPLSVSLITSARRGKMVPTKEKGRFARKNSFVENRLHQRTGLFERLVRTAIYPRGKENISEV